MNNEQMSKAKTQLQELAFKNKYCLDCTYCTFALPCLRLRLCLAFAFTFQNYLIRFASYLQVSIICLAEDAMVHVSVKQINYNCQHNTYKFIMRYNELTYHKASPFYKQDYLPDRAWYNRKPKDFPSQIPTGQEYFDYNGRKHFNNKFNHSQIASENILQSPERYPHENKIALDKTYMRNLDTLDIQGAASGTRVNQSIKNKMKAQQELARRYNQPLDMHQHKDKTYEVKRRQLALKQYENLQERKVKEKQLQNSRISQQNMQPAQQQERNPQNYTPYYADSNNYGKKYISLLPKAYYANLNSKNLNQPLPKISNKNNQAYQQQKNNQYYQQQQYVPPQPSQQNYEPEVQLRRYQSHLEKQDEHNHLVSANNRFKSNPQYYNAYDAEWHRRRQQHVKNMEIDQLTKNKLQDKKQFRKYNPTNLSLNLAAQQIVGANR